jgi:hypothetical protein
LVVPALLSGLAVVFASVLAGAAEDRAARPDWAERKDGADNEAAVNSARALDETQRRFI